LYKNDKFVAVRNKSYKIPTVNLSALGNSCANVAFHASELIFTLLSAGSIIQNASQQFVWRIHLSAGSIIQNASQQFLWRIHLSAANFALHPTPQTKL
jgi:hypothetical protein